MSSITVQVPPNFHLDPYTNDPRKFVTILSGLVKIASIPGLQEGQQGYLLDRGTYFSVPCKPGDTVFFSVSIKADPWAGAVRKDIYASTTGGGRICLDFYGDVVSPTSPKGDVTNKWRHGNCAVTPTGKTAYVEWGHDWTTQSVTALALAGDTRVVFGIGARPPDTGASAVYFEDFKISITSPAPNCPTGQHWDATQNACVPDVVVHTCPTGQHWDDATQACIPDTPTKSFAARTIGPFGLPLAAVHLLWLAREKLIRPEVHKKLHPLV